VRSSFSFLPSFLLSVRVEPVETLFSLTLVYAGRKSRSVSTNSTRTATKENKERSAT
jgi:hypothetical protein